MYKMSTKLQVSNTFLVFYQIHFFIQSYDRKTLEVYLRYIQLKKWTTFFDEIISEIYMRLHM